VADNLAFSELQIPASTVTAVDITIIIYLIAATAEISENSLIIYCFSSALVCSILQKRKAFAPPSSLSLSRSSAVTNSFL